MKNMSLFQVLLTAFFGISAVIGLFVFATYKGGSADAQIGKVTIWGTLPSDDFTTAISRLSGVNQSLKEVTYLEKNATTLASDLATAIATNNSPDLVLTSQEELRGISKFISPISTSLISNSSYQNTFIGGASLFTVAGGGGYWGLPLLVDPLVLYANRTILTSNGVARAPDTWEGVTGLASKLAILTPTRQVSRALIPLGTYPNVRDARAILSTLFLQAGAPISSASAAGTPVADLGTRVSSGEPLGRAVLTFYTQFADPSKVSYTWNASLANSAQAFLSGDTAFYLGFASYARSLRQMNPNLDFVASVAPQPATASAKVVFGKIYTLFVSRAAPNANGAYQIASLLSEDPNVQLTLSAHTGLAPANLTALTQVPEDPALALAYVEALYTRGWLSPQASETDRIFSGMITDVISGRSTIPAALSTAEGALTAALQQ